MRAPAIQKPSGVVSVIQAGWRKQQLVARSSEYTQYEGLRVFCGTWNVNGKAVEKEEGDLAAWLFAPGSSAEHDLADVYAVGFQEIVELNPKNVALSDAQSAKRSVQWEAAILAKLNARNPSDSTARYVAVASEHLVGILLCVFVKRRYAAHVRCVASATAGVGMFGVAGNKGGAAVRMQLYGTTLCFISSHLAAHRKAVVSRNSDFASIMAKMELRHDRADASRGEDPVFARYRRAMADVSSSSAGGGAAADESGDEAERRAGGADASGIAEHDVVLWLGDLNYRIAMEVPIETVFARMGSGDLAWLEAHDQLKIEHAAGRVFAGFEEGSVTNFMPTYKYTPGTDTHDQRPEKKLRAPAWCDRILYAAADPAHAPTLIEYASTNALRISDHKPVFATFDIDVKQLVGVELRRVLNEIQRTVDLWENDAIPRVQLALLDPITRNVTVTFSTSGDVDFGTVAYRTPVTRYLRLENVGQQMAAFRFVPKPEQTSVSKSWLDVSPAMGMVMPHEAVVIALTATVWGDVAAELGAAGATALDDILVLHVENGADFFLPITVAWAGSAYGARLEALVALAGPARVRGGGAEAGIAGIAEAEGGAAAGGPAALLTIPKEMWRLVDALQRGELFGQPGIFRVPGDEAEVAKVRVALDTGSVLPTSADALALGTALVELLRSSGDPIVPTELCPSEGFDSGGVAWWCASLLEQLPPLRHNVLVYLVAFLRELLQPAHAATNQLTAATLSEIFGSALFSAVPAASTEVSRLEGTFTGEGTARARAAQTSTPSTRHVRREEVGAILNYFLTSRELG